VNAKCFFWLRVLPLLELHRNTRGNTGGNTVKRLTDLITDGFVWRVGITLPKPAQQRRAGIYITAISIAALFAVAALFFFAAHLIQHHR
jgi:hypothetical protein